MQEEEIRCCSNGRIFIKDSFIRCMWILCCVWTVEIPQSGWMVTNLISTCLFCYLRCKTFWRSSYDGLYHRYLVWAELALVWQQSMEKIWNSREGKLIPSQEDECIGSWLIITLCSLMFDLLPQLFGLYSATVVDYIPVEKLSDCESCVACVEAKYCILSNPSSGQFIWFLILRYFSYLSISKYCVWWELS